MQQSKYFILYSSTNKFILLEKVKIQPLMSLSVVLVDVLVIFDHFARS